MAWAKDRQVVRYQRVIEPELSACLDLGWRSGLWGIGHSEVMQLVSALLVKGYVLRDVLRLGEEPAERGRRGY